MKFWKEIFRSQFQKVHLLALAIVPQSVQLTAFYLVQKPSQKVQNGRILCASTFYKPISPGHGYSCGRVFGCSAPVILSPLRYVLCKVNTKKLTVIHEQPITPVPQYLLWRGFRRSYVPSPLRRFERIGPPASYFISTPRGRHFFRHQIPASPLSLAPLIPY